MKVVAKALAASACAWLIFHTPGLISAAAAQGIDPVARMQQLYTRIKTASNRTLVVYSAYPTMPPVLARFMKDYPEVQAVHEVASGAALRARLQAEKESGNYSADIAISAPVDMVAIERDGYFQKYMPEYAASLPDNFKSQSNAIGIPFRTLFALTYNTSLVPANEVPQNLDQALNEKWKDRIGYATPTGYSAFDVCTGTLWYDHMLTEAQLRKLHTIGKGIQANTEVITQVAQGRMIIGLWGPSQTTYRLQLDNAPVQTKFLADMAVLFGPGAAMLAHAPHADAAKLFLEWLYSPHGQLAFAEEMGSYGTMPGAPLPKGQPELTGYDVKDIPIDQSPEILGRYRQITRAIWAN